MPIQLGIDCFKEQTDTILKKGKYVLITGSSTVDSEGIPVYHWMKKNTGSQMDSIWSLQHGFFIDKQDNMILSPSFYWKEMDVHVRSLYRERLVPETEWLEGINTIVVDIFDVGTRVYTFINHIVLLMEHLSDRDIQWIILDRPNPLNGIHMEGNVSEEKYSSIVNTIPVPMRHGLTAGEYLLLAKKILDLNIQMEVIGVKNWNRKRFYSHLWTYPSPNMPTFETALVYPGGVLLEGTSLSEGRGTTKPFQLVGAPFIDQFELFDHLKKNNFPGVSLVPISFKPEFSKHAGQVNNGIMVHPENPGTLQSFPVYYEIIRLVKFLYPEKFKWKNPPYEFETQRPPIDMICGSDTIRKAIERNLCYDEIASAIQTGIGKFQEQIQDILLYD